MIIIILRSDDTTPDIFFISFRRHYVIAARLIISIIAAFSYADATPSPRHDISLITNDAAALIRRRRITPPIRCFCHGVFFFFLYALLPFAALRAMPRWCECAMKRHAATAYVMMRGCAKAREKRAMRRRDERLRDAAPFMFVKALAQTRCARVCALLATRRDKKDAHVRAALL
jgi:hypothetical protein